MRYINEGADLNLNLTGFIETTVVLNKHDLAGLEMSGTEHAEGEVQIVTAQKW